MRDILLASRDMQPSPDGGALHHYHALEACNWNCSPGFQDYPHPPSPPPPMRAALTAVSSCQVPTPEIAKQTPSAIISSNIHMIRANHERTAAHLKVFNRNDFCQTPD